MTAEIFFLPHQASQAEAIAKLLRTHVFPGIECSMQKIEWKRGVTEIGRYYVKLLQAAIRPDESQGIVLQVKELEFLGYRFYIEVFFPFAYRSRTFQSDSLATFFPAVAIRGRMAAVPVGVGPAISKSMDDISPLNPFRSGGVEEMDLHHVASVQTPAMAGKWAEIGQSYRHELLQQMRSLAATWPAARKMGVEEIGRRIGVDPGYIEYVLQAEVVNLATYREIECGLSQTSVRHGRWTRLNLIVRNASEVPLRDLSVEVSGPAQILPDELRTSVDARSVREVPLSVFPENKGHFPLKIVATLPQDSFFANWLPVHHVWMECE